MAAKNMGAARRTPLIAAVPKMIFPVLVILPGMIAAALAIAPSEHGGYRLPPKPMDVAVLAKAVPVVKDAAQSHEDVAATSAKIKEAIDEDVIPDKIAAVVAASGAAGASDTQIEEGVQNAVKSIDFDGVILSLVKRYCPPGLLGLALTGLLASFMSGMAGNVTAFNTVWTYDLYQAYLNKNKSDEHYMKVAKGITVVGILFSIVCAYLVSQWSNAMDIIQLVFGFVNAPLFATFLLGMFWKRTTGTGAFLGLLAGTGTSALFHALTAAGTNAPGIKGGYLAAHLLTNGPIRLPSEMAQNFYLAAFAFTACFILTAGISLVTAQNKTDEELKGLVYSLTPKIKDEHESWYLRPATLALVLLVGCVALNIIFF
jgi:SSS family solute:Na+ symporter